MKNTLCRKCIYYRRLGSSKGYDSNMACHYLLDTGHMRGCSPMNCRKFKGRRGKSDNQRIAEKN